LNAWEIARRLLQDYGEAAEAECDARASYHAMQGDPAAAEQWRRLKRTVQLARSRPEGGGDSA